MAWIAYAVAWLIAAVFWTLASAAGARLSPLVALPYAAVALGSAAVMGVGVWWLSGRLRWDWRSPRFFLIHAAAAAAYSLLYAMYWLWLDLFTGRVVEAFRAFRSSPVTSWNLIMGALMYLVVAGLSYAIRAHQRLRVQEVAAAEARLLAQQAQLTALRAQLNPHFLFNALHTVGALVTSDPARADRALEGLGDLLRYTLNADDEVLLQHEWRFTQDYLAFEQLRLGARLRVDAHADAAALSVPVPPLILQPLVENAVRHGIADRPDGGRITLDARIDGVDLRLTVVDDGRGESLSEGVGVGLGSVRARLQVLYGDRAALRLDRGSAGFTVTILLPVASDRGLGSAA